MKHFPVVFALAAASFCSSSEAVPRPGQNAPKSPAANARPDASLKDYYDWMAKGRAIKAELSKSFSFQQDARDAVNAFQQAVLYAPELTQRAEAWVEQGEVMYDMRAYPQAFSTFLKANKQTLTPDFKRRALFGIAQAEFWKADEIETRKPGTLKTYATKLRANYDAALKSGAFTNEQMRRVDENLAQLDKSEGKHLDAARRLTNLLKTTPKQSQWDRYEYKAIEHLQKTITLSPKEQAEAVTLTDEVYKIYLPKIKGNRFAKKEFEQAQIEYSNLLSQFGEKVRAEAMWKTIAENTDVDLEIRAQAIVKIAQSQAAQKKYEDALKTLDRVTQLGESFAARRHFERGKVFLAQQKLDAANDEYLKILLLKPLSGDQKVEANWGFAAVVEREIAQLRQKNAPTAALSAKLNSQKTFLLAAAMEKTATPSFRKEAMLKMAQWERAQGNEEEAKKWE